MGVYLYGLKKLRKPQTITREDGAVVTATHTLSFRCRPWLGLHDDPKERLALGKLKSVYGERFEGIVLHHTMVIIWSGEPHWYDTGDWPGQVWGVVTDEKFKGEYDQFPETTTASKARLPNERER